MVLASVPRAKRGQDGSFIPKRAGWFALLAALACQLNSASLGQAATYSLQPPESSSINTFVYEFIPQNLEGLFSGLLGTAKSSVGHNVVSLLKFDLADLISDAVASSAVTSATLRLTTIHNTLGGADPAPGHTVFVDVFANDDTPWTETGVTWPGKPGTTGDAYASKEVTGINQVVTFDVTSLVKNWLDGTPANNGLQLIQEAAVDNGSGVGVGATFNSASAASAGDRPLLQINTVPEPATAILLGTGAAFSLAYMCSKRMSRRKQTQRS